MDFDSALLGNKSKSKRKRLLTEDRRKQNREAQRRFRERRKQPQSKTSIAVLRDKNPQTEPCPDQDLFQITNGLLFDNTFGDLNSFDEGTPLISPTALQTMAPIARTSASQPLHLPSPYRNYLQIQKLNFYAARIQNALYIGVPLVLAQKEEDTISPHYWHAQFASLMSQSNQHHLPNATNIGSSNDPCSIWPAYMPRPLRRRPCFQLSQSIAPDLAATPLQRSHPHGMYLDLIPFPIFRDIVITLLSMSPPAFDEITLKRDIEAEGLLVWGVDQGSTDRTASLVRDRRNWECAKWFLKKWRLLVHGSGLDEQSRWWRKMRGDESDDEEDT